jgi:membrane-bound metal-dependent hydrolase YbcI (DUF457 family)
MSSFVINLFVPLLIAMGVGIFPRKQCLKWIWVAVIPDIDYFTYNSGVPWLPNLHRGILHNALILFVLIGLTTWAYYRQEIKTGTRSLGAFLQSRWGVGGTLSSFYYLCHITFDTFAGGIAPFYPFTTWSLAFDFRILVDTATNTPRAQGSTTTSANVPDPSPTYLWLSAEETALVLLVALAFGLMWLTRTYLRNRGPAVVVKAKPVASDDGPR